MGEPVERIYRPLKTMLWQNFLGGIAWGLGVTIGLSIVLAILGFVISKINFIPIVGGFVSSIVEFVGKNKLQ